MSEHDDLTAEEERALRALGGAAPPPPALEEATLARLRGEGLVRRPRRAALPRVLAAAAAIALFAAGLAVGRRTLQTGGAVATDSAPQFVLFLYDAPAEPAMSDAQMQERVSEYRDWAIGLRRAGAEIRGEKLKRDRSERLGPAAPGEAPLGGYFVIQAKDWASAMEVARSCPHLKHGGTIEVREVERT
jgi:hypothetical protein